LSTFIKPPVAIARARAALRNGAVHLFVCLSPKRVQNAIFSQIKQSRAMVSIDEQ